MKLMVMKNYDEISKACAGMISELVKKNSEAILGLATGSTPIGTYKELIRMHKEEGLDFSKIKSFNLDEYVGLGGDHPNSYRYFMDHELFNHINIIKDNTNVPNGKANNLEEFCKEYDEKIDRAGGVDIQILGIGSNGHIAFNEPSSELSVGTFVVSLTESTIEDNKRFFESIDDVPKKAITMGIGTIMKAKKIILLANGKSKANAIKRIVEDRKLTTEIPASLLLLHPDVTFIVDEEAYGK
ncbi:glucosamine-6-phosphate deaminase [Tissierella creatinini]|nr:glucosamine-6-phosphate deaminase [Tissierella creatinini]TJX66657.1 glucosamine-6-phosphate deaminase [Soehngenia saccharolytica]